MGMSTGPRFLALSCVTFVLVAASPKEVPVFQMRKVLDGPTEDSEQVVLLHQTRGREQPVKEVLNVAKTPVLADSAVKGARVRADSITGKPQIEINFTEQGRKQFAEITKANVNKRLAIIVSGKVLCAPVIRTEIPGGQAVISGDFSAREAKELADAINRATKPDAGGKLKPWTHGPYDQLRVIAPPSSR